jgi:MFS family permease
MGAMTHEFGWTRTQFSSALLVQMLCGLIAGPTGGFLLDRIGPRRMLLLGIIPFTLALSLFALTNGALWQWWLFAALLSLTSTGVGPNTWILGIVRSFDRARGLAMAMALAGVGVATAIWPVIVARLITLEGWRLAYPTIAVGWMILILPLTIGWYRPAELPPVSGVKTKAVSVWPVLRLGSFWLLLGAGCLFVNVALALTLHLIPILQAHHLSLVTAGSLAFLTGIFSILGRVGTGFLLDRLPSRPIALVAFSLPLPVLALLGSPDAAMPQLIAASMLLGLAMGAETDVVAYMASRRFDTRIFGSVYALFQVGFSIFASLGPVLASKLFDISGNYDRYFLVALPITLTALVLITCVPGLGKARL